MKINADPGNRENIRWWSEARFGMFVHFGLYALLQRGEWVMYREGIPLADYRRLMERFNPSLFDADAWVELARAAGARYIALTAKHHDGFCLFDSALTDFKITNTPFGRDLVGELVAACHRQDMRIVLYYSQPDWQHPNFVNRPGAFKEWQCERSGNQPDWARYQDYLEGQVRELCTKYGRIDGIWWDGSHRSEADWRGRRLYELIKSHHPHAVVNDRARYGDFFTPERSIPDLPVDAPCECCQSIHTKSWGFKAGGPYWSVPALVGSLVRTASLGANFLLNVGPRPDGTISEPEQERMRLIGDWLREHGPGIYGTAGCPLDPEPPGAKATRQDKSVFLHLLEWPESDWIEVPAIGSDPARARLLGQDGELRAERVDGVLRIGPLPAQPPAAGIQTLALDFAAAPTLSLRAKPVMVAPVIAIDGDEAIELGVESAAFAGYGVKASELKMSHWRGPDGVPVPVVANFLAEDQSLAWTVHCRQTGTYRVEVLTRIAAPYGGSVLAVEAAGQTLVGSVGPLVGDESFTRTELGTVTLPAGEHPIRLQPRSLALGYTLGGSLRGLRLEPVRPTAGT